LAAQTHSQANGGGLVKYPGWELNLPAMAGRTYTGLARRP